MKKLLILIVITALSSTNVKAQTNPQDTVKRISLQDIREFNTYLMKSVSYEEYNKLTPEATLQQLWLYIERKRTQSIEKQIPKSK